MPWKRCAIANVVVTGSGVMGLVAAFHAINSGHTVEVLEVAPDPGGMAAHFDLAGLSIERFCHFVCKSDLPTMELLEMLGIPNQLRWRLTSMGLFTKGRLHDWGTPLALLRFDEIRLISRLRCGLLAYLREAGVTADTLQGLPTSSPRKVPTCDSR
jgi:protoporphyrinogen oxidase